MKEVVIAGYLRTAQSRSRPTAPEKDWFHKLRADDLLAKVIPAVMEKSRVTGDEIDDLIIGSALGVTEQWTFGGRTPVFLADLSPRTAARYVDQQCGSGMAAIQIGFMEIATGFADVVLACGMEHMTRVPMGPTLFNNGVLSMNPGLYSREDLAHWDMPVTMNMGLTAEKLCEQTGFSREDLDRWGARSHHRAAEAQQNGFFDGEILPLDVEQADGSMMTVDRDQAVRADSTAEGMGNLKPVFRADGVVTAGNSSPLSAGAGTMVLMSAETAAEKGVRPLGVIRSIGFAGVDPTIMGAGPVPAIQMALEKADLKASDMDVWEINEAFSIVALNGIQELKLNPEKVNIHGSGIALGHPLGVTGIRITGTLARILDEQKGRYGCAAACIGGGQGIATIVERFDA